MFSEYLPESLVIYLFLALSIAYFVFGMDDLLIDILSRLKKAYPRELKEDEFRRILELPERRMAVVIAAWQEAGVLERMVSGNLSAIAYQNYDIFIGVYPNDTPTLEEARLLARRYGNVKVVENSLPGPTSKGQMVNELIRGALSHEKEDRIRYDAFVIQDSEDLIHPYSLKIMNWKLADHDFVQLPVLPLEVPVFSCVAQSYIGEFAEAHSKDALVRASFGLSLPSAGVGTALSRKLIDYYRMRLNGDLLNASSLTEDYELGLQTLAHGLKSTFACYYTKQGGKKNYVATREYFPRQFWFSVKQRTRWTLGIAFQGWRNLGWRGSLLEKYFLYRDRKCPWVNILVLAGLLFFGYLLANPLPEAEFQLIFEQDGELLIALAAGNTFFMVNRVFHRGRAVLWCYHWRAVFPAIVALPVGNIVNAVAAIRASFQYSCNRAFGWKLSWSKTQHELPKEFGLDGEKSKAA